MFRDIVGTVAGNGAFGISGDGGPATAAAINAPYGLVFDRSGNLYYSDIGSHRVRKINPNGIITTFAGAGPGFAGDGGPAMQALLHSPADLATAIEARFERSAVLLFVANCESDSPTGTDTRSAVGT